ncbi:MAG: YbjN domain-containing protein [Nocardioides sp.]
MTGPTSARGAADAVRAWLGDTGFDFEEPTTGMFSFAVPGEKKLQTPVRIDVGTHTLAIHAFVCRAPDEQHERVYRWLLQQNLKTFGVAFALDRLGDIYLDGRLPLTLATPEELDRLVGVVMATADQSFNVLLELGFESAIRAEWE